MTKSIFICVFLAGCTYRYGTSSFVVDNRTTEPVAPTAEPYPMQVPTETTTTKQVVPCKNETTEKLVVTNQLDSKNNTIVTTAVSTRTEDQENPCK